MLPRVSARLMLPYQIKLLNSLLLTLCVFEFFHIKNSYFTIFSVDNTAVAFFLHAYFLFIFYSALESPSPGLVGKDILQT